MTVTAERTALARGADQAESYSGLLSAVDLPLRTLACLGVVIVHVNLLLRPSMDVWWPAGYLTSCFYSLPVPLFFMLSGYGAGGLGHKPAKLGNFLRRKFHGILVPFLVWNAVLILLVLRNAGQSWAECGVLFLTGVWQLYYLFVLLQLLYLKQYVSRRQLPYVLVAAAVGALAYYGLADFWMWTRGVSSSRMEVQFNRTVFPWGIYFFTGIWLRQSPRVMQWIAARKWYFFGVWALSYLAYSTELRMEGAYLNCHPLQQIVLAGLPFQWFGAMSLIILFCEMERHGFLMRIRRALAFFGRDSYGVYLAHTTVLVLILKAYDRTETSVPYLLEVPSAILLTWLLSWGMARTLRLLPWRGPRRVLFGG